MPDNKIYRSLDVIGVFHKLPQPSVSPVGPHLKQVLLGATEQFNQQLKNKQNNILKLKKNLL
jgi:hypothetical protein